MSVPGNLTNLNNSEFPSSESVAEPSMEEIVQAMRGTPDPAARAELNEWQSLEGISNLPSERFERRLIEINSPGADYLYAATTQPTHPVLGKQLIVALRDYEKGVLRVGDKELEKRFKVINSDTEFKFLEMLHTYFALSDELQAQKQEYVSKENEPLLAEVIGLEQEIGERERKAKAKQEITVESEVPGMKVIEANEKPLEEVKKELEAKKASFAAELTRSHPESGAVIAELLVAKGVTLSKLGNEMTKRMQKLTDTEYIRKQGVK